MTQRPPSKRVPSPAPTSPLTPAASLTAPGQGASAMADLRPTPTTITWLDEAATPAGLAGLWWGAGESELQSRVPENYACRVVRARMGVRELAWPIDANWLGVVLGVTLVLEDGGLVRVHLNGRPGAFMWAAICDAGFVTRDEGWAEREADGTRIAVDLFEGNVRLEEAL